MAGPINDFTEEQLREAADYVRHVTGSDDVEVSVDGSWRKRGHQSAYAIAFAMSTRTG